MPIPQTKSLAALATADGAEVQVEPGNWTAVHTPVAATQATASKVGAAGIAHVCTGIFASIACGATPQTPIKVRLRDSTTGVGTILFEKVVSVLAGDSKTIDIDGLSIPGTAGNAMTLEFEAAGVAASIESVTLTGYDLTQ